MIGDDVAELPPSLSLMPPLTVFWPIDVVQDGYVFGWHEETTTVVAGTCYFSTRADALSALSRLDKLNSEQGVSHPTLELLGVYTGQGQNCESLVDWKYQPTSDRHSVYYIIPKRGSKRHYSLTSINLESLLAIQDYHQAPSLESQHSECQASQAFFVENREAHSLGLSARTLEQMNTADLLMSKLAKLTEPGSSLELSSHSVLLTSTIFMAIRWCNQLADLLCLLQSACRRFYGVGPWMLASVASVQQLDLRCEQVIFVLRQAWLLDRTEQSSNNERSAHYISGQNCIWLILNDVIIGSAVGVFLVENSSNLAILTHKFASYTTIGLIRNSITWLDNWPAGLKLNTELSRFLYLILNALIDFWEVILNCIAKILPNIITFVGISGVLGMTMILALTSDFTSLLNIHLSASYTIVRVAFRTQLLMVNSLFNLFRGKRFNMLRSRLDDWNYDLDQLLLGTMLLALTNFLFPTVTVYYMLFALSRLSELTLQAGLKVALALFNHFPLFAFTLRIKDPWRLPGGITLRPYKIHSSSPQTFIIQNSSIGMSKIFGQYAVLGSRILLHYNPGRLIVDLLKGNRLDPIPHSSFRYTYATNSPPLLNHTRTYVRY